MDIGPPDWPPIVSNLILAVRAARGACKSTRSPKKVVKHDDSLSAFAFRQEIEKYIGDARRAVDPSRRDEATVEWRAIVLNLLRAHSLEWEIIWAENDGIQLDIASGSSIPDRDPVADEYILDAVRALAATNPNFDHVEWRGREVLKAQ